MQRIGSSFDKWHMWDLWFCEGTFFQARAWLGKWRDKVIIYLNKLIHFITITLVCNIK